MCTKNMTKTLLISTTSPDIIGRRMAKKKANDFERVPVNGKNKEMKEKQCSNKNML